MSQGKRKRKGKSRSRRTEPGSLPPLDAAAGAGDAGEAKPAPRASARPPSRPQRSASGDQAGLPLDREAKLGKAVGVLAMASVLATFVAITFTTKASGDGPQPVSLSGDDVGNDADRAERLMDYADHESDQLIAALLHVGALLVAIAVGVYLYWLVRNRTPSIPRYVLWLAFVGPLAYAGAAGLGHLALADVADEFVSSSGAKTADRAEDFMTDSGLFQAAQILDIAGRLVFAAWLGLISREAMNVELLGRFLGIFGVGAAFAIVAGVLGLTIGEAMYIGWLASVGIMAMGRWPGGRPEGWSYRIDPATAE